MAFDSSDGSRLPDCRRRRVPQSVRMPAVSGSPPCGIGFEFRRRVPFHLTKFVRHVEHLLARTTNRGFVAVPPVRFAGLGDHEHEGVGSVVTACCRTMALAFGPKSITLTFPWCWVLWLSGRYCHTSPVRSISFSGSCRASLGLHAVANWNRTTPCREIESSGRMEDASLQPTTIKRKKAKPFFLVWSKSFDGRSIVVLIL